MTLNPRTTRTARRLFRACQVDGTVDGARARRVVARLAASRAHRDRVMAKVMKDKRLANMMDPKAMPFDAKRMIYGGFKVLVDA